MLEHSFTINSSNYHVYEGSLENEPHHLKGVADLCLYQLATMQVQKHVDTVI